MNRKSVQSTRKGSGENLCTVPRLVIENRHQYSVVDLLKKNSVVVFFIIFEKDRYGVFIRLHVLPPSQKDCCSLTFRNCV